MIFTKARLKILGNGEIDASEPHFALPGISIDGGLGVFQV
jgi:hypothetical protein